MKPIQQHGDIRLNDPVVVADNPGYLTRTRVLMEIDSDMTPLPRIKLVKYVVAAPPRPPAVAKRTIGSKEESKDSDGSEEPTLEYVTQMERSYDDALLAAALSCQEIKLYARDTMVLGAKLAGHKGALTQLAFSPQDCHGLFSASEDGTVRGWDTRSTRSTITFGQSGEEVWSVALGYDGHLCAAGKGVTIDFFDLRKVKAGETLRTYRDCHTDAVTQLCFHPVKHSFLLTGSEDGLMCYYDTGVSSEEDALDSVLNAECAVRTLGFFGPEADSVYCCSNTETLSIWDPASAQRIVDYGDVRALSRGQSPASADDSERDQGKGAAEVPWREWDLPVDYIVGCRYETEGDRLWLMAGGFDGEACLATVSRESITPEGVLGGGHSEQIRTFDWLGRSVATGGEDAKICLWRVPGDGLDDRASRMVEEQGSEDEREGEEDRRGDAEAREGSMAQATSAGRRADKRAGRMFRPYDTDKRRR